MKMNILPFLAAFAVVVQSLPGTLEDARHQSSTSSNPAIEALAGLKPHAITETLSTTIQGTSIQSLAKTMPPRPAALQVIQSRITVTEEATDNAALFPTAGYLMLISCVGIQMGILGVHST
ncbi:hypothetical protein B0J14DRAFT_650142 [Halenospora varia]|nr:hypothetical protein B0J14DRAFT_650142 [Halenospora varia]